MEILKRNLAPISTAAWEVIDNTARDVLKANLSARRFVDINGPYGMGFTGINLGRLENAKGEKGNVQYGIYAIQPLVETRTFFSLKIWELDNIARGAKDIQLDSLVDAGKKAAAFEETAIYDGLKDGKIKGIFEIGEKSKLTLLPEYDSIVECLQEELNKMKEVGIADSFNFIVNKELWKVVNKPVPGGVLKNILEQELGGKVLYSAAIDKAGKKAVLASAKGGDFELTLGQDFSIGYHHHTHEEISLFLTESFSFRVIVPEALVIF